MKKPVEPKKDNTFCSYPFKEQTLKIWNDQGQLSSTTPCCMMMNFDHTGVPIVNLKNKSPAAIYQHHTYRSLRKDMLNNKRNAACKVCWDMEDRGQTSYRFFSPHITKEEIKHHKLSTLDITLSNVCNLACRMCDVSNSNQLNKDYDEFDRQGTREELTNISGAFRKKYPLQKQHLSRQFKWLLKNTKEITTLKASGGEPFYDKHIMNLLKVYIENDDAKNTSLEFHTNGTVIDDRVVNTISKFKENAHTFSVDGTGKVYEYIRHKANFDILDNNIRNYIKLDNVSILDFNFVMSAHNVHNIIDFIKWTRSFNYRKKISWSEVYPVYRGIHIGNLPTHILQPIYDEIEAMEWREEEKKYVVLELLQLAIDQPFKNKGAEKLYRETVIFDKARNQSYKKYLERPMVEYISSIPHNI